VPGRRCRVRQVYFAPGPPESRGAERP